MPTSAITTPSTAMTPASDRGPVIETALATPSVITANATNNARAVSVADGAIETACRDTRPVENKISSCETRPFARGDTTASTLRGIGTSCTKTATAIPVSHRANDTHVRRGDCEGRNNKPVTPQTIAVTAKGQNAHG